MFHKALHNWKAKVVCVFIATILWYLINQNVNQRGSAQDWPTPAASFN